MTTKVVNKQAWQQHAQPFESRHWDVLGEPQAALNLAGCRDMSRQIWERFGFQADSFKGQRVLDVGCGPTGRLTVFTEGHFEAIEPLVEHYRTLAAACLEPYCAIHPIPAEERLEALVGQFDSVVSLNALDHGYDLGLALRNIHDYLKPGGFFFLSMDVDKNREYDPTHPICVLHRNVHAALEAAGFSVQRVDHGRCYPATPRWRESWGGGTAWHWWTARNS